MSLRPFIRSPWGLRILSRSITRHHRPPPFPTVPTCPSPTCACTQTPSMPEGLEIDYSKPLNGTMAAYAEQVLICTGKEDWVSRIEEEHDGDNLAADIKGLLGRGGIYANPFHNVAIANTSFPPAEDIEGRSTSAYILPSFKYIPSIPRDAKSLESLVRGYLLPRKLNPAHKGLSSTPLKKLVLSESQRKLLHGQDIKDVLVLICGHGGRDMRCGITGPILRETFQKLLPRKGFEVKNGSVDDSPLGGISARVGLISHVGGHRFAGNVILYLPPGMKTAEGESHPLAACGIWYGRVEPKHVEGIIQESILGGRVIEDLFRGGIKQGGEILRM